MILSKSADLVIPAWARWVCLACAGAIIFLFGQLHGERVAGQHHLDYVTAQAGQTVKVTKEQTKIVIQTEIEYRDRIQKIYIKGVEIEKQVPIYITPADNDRFGVNVGFVRSHNAAWSGELAGPAAESDREPAGIPLADVAYADASNATSCSAWREQALGLREFYRKLQAVTNVPP
ncbi:MAG: hypothetical protein ACOH2B_12255 [Burkholderiaceae bacterium]